MIPKWASAVLVALLLVSAVMVDCQHNSSEEEDDDNAEVMEIVFSFDTTGSMYPVLANVRTVVSDMIRKLQSDIPGIRIAVFAHGDWQDAKKTYATSWVDFTTDVDALQNFVSGVKQTAGGDLPEAYELVLHQVSRELSWTHGSRRSLVMIGDNIPHEADYYANVLNISWRAEADYLKSMGVRIYAIRALDYNSEAFYRTIAHKTDGVYLRLDDFNSIMTFIMAISYREHGLQYLAEYEKEVRKQGNVSGELETLFRTLKQNPVRRSTRVQLDPTGAPTVSTTSRTYTRNITTTTTTITRTRHGRRRVITSVHGSRMVVPTGPEVKQLYVESDISYRFATSTLTTKLVNRQNFSDEATFDVVLPKAAFISNFTMIIDDISYPGEVKEKEAAKRKYDAARRRGESAGHVAVSPRNTNKFKVSVNLASRSKVEFVLVYQEMLRRRLGVYNHVVHVDASRIIPDLQIAVNIHESRDLTYLHVPEKHGDLLNEIGAHMDNPLAIITRPAPNKARIVYRPTPKQQMERAAAGLAGKFIIEYDVERTRDAGEVQIVDGYFVHYLAPDGLPPAPKNIMFVLDTSGSMYNRKIHQVKNAMKTILKELRPGDYFNVMHFGDFVNYWQQSLVLASKDNKHHAQRWIKTMRATGGTNINLALERAMQMLGRHTESMPSHHATSMIVFLTDGQPTSGVTNIQTILDNVRTYNTHHRYTLFSLGFGRGVNFQFLTKLSLQNNGIARKIYEDSDAELQLEGFYTEIGTPTLSQVEVTYLDNSVDNTSLTQTSYRNFFEGGEIIVTGQLNDLDTAMLKAKVDANSVSGPWSHSVDIMVGDDPAGAPSTVGLQNNFERMWAYLTIKELLKKSIETTSAEEKAELKQKALDLSLRYHFVTPLTSMVVVKPEAEEVEDIEDPEDPEELKRKHVTTSKSSRVSRGHGKTYRPSVPSRSSRRHSGSRSFADSDPHFIVQIRGSVTPICFDVMGTPGQIFNLVYDPTTDIVVNGLIVGKKNNTLEKPEKAAKTYFGKIAVHHGPTSIVFTPHKIRYGKTDIKWKDNTTITEESFTLTLMEKNMIKVSLGENIDFVIMRHLVREDHPVKVSFLGIYIENDGGLSDEAHGLLGQFKQLKVVGVDKDINEVQEKSTGILKFSAKPDHRPDIEVTAGHRENLASHEVVPCWFVHNNGRKLLDGRHLDYIVPHISYRKAPPKLLKKGILGDQ